MLILSVNHTRSIIAAKTVQRCRFTAVVNKQKRNCVACAHFDTVIAVIIPVCQYGVLRATPRFSTATIFVVVSSVNAESGSP